MLAVRRLGQGTPATMLLHGMFASGRYWGAAYDGLADHGALVVPDLAGFGRSVATDAGFSPDDHADLVAHTIRQAGAGAQPLVVGAHSLGCLVAVHLARHHPDLVAGIVPGGPPGPAGALAEDRFQHTYRSYSQTLAQVVVSAGAAAEVGQLAVPVHLVAGADDSLLDLAFLAELAERHPHVRLSVWPQSEHELPLTASDRCVAAVRQLRDRVVPSATSGV